MTYSHLLAVLLPLSTVCLLSLPVHAGPPSKRARPNYFVVVKAPVLAGKLDADHGPALSRTLRHKLGQSSALSLDDAHKALGKSAVRRLLRRQRMAGLLTVPRASCRAPRRVGGKTVIRCQVSLLLVTLRRQSMVSALGCAAEVESHRPTLPPEHLHRLQQDVLATAADGAADELATFLVQNRPGTGRLPRRGR